MKPIQILFTSLFVLFSYGLNAQTPDSLEQIANRITAEATRMYKSEMASWYGTDVLMEQYKDKTTQLGGYFSYSENGIDKCVFYSKDETPKALLTVSFKGVYSIKKAESEAVERDLTPLEKDYFAIRQATTEAVNSDTLFKTYKNTNYNLIPVIDSNSRKVYILTGPQNSGVVLFGNDYELIFDKNNKVLSKRKIHNSLITLDYTGEKQQVGAAHTHLSTTGDFMTSTDICTLMLYGKTAKWQSHFVIGEKYMSIWNIESNSLVIMDKDDFENGGKSKAKKKKKKN